MYVSKENLTMSRVIDSSWNEHVWVCVCVRIQLNLGGGVLSCVETRGKANILHNTPSHTFLWSLKGAASCVCLPYHPLVLAGGNRTHTGSLGI